METSEQSVPDQMVPESKSISVNVPEKTNQVQDKVGNYIISKCIGSGAFGKVYLGIHLITGQKVAIKVVQKQRITSKLIDRVKRQIKILCKLHHPCIVQLYELIEKEKHMYLFMEYVSEGELFNYIVKSKKLNERQACNFFQQLINGIEYFHKCGVAHRDLKPENILIDDNKRIKIIDFGLSNTYGKNEKLQTACGSPCYVAPEMIQEKCSYDPLEVDIWSAGVILYAMLCGCLPFMDTNPKKIYQKIKTGFFKVPKTLSLEAKSLIARMLCVDPSRRISIQQIRSHRWWERFPETRLYGIVPTQHQIPIDTDILQRLTNYNINPGKVKVALQKNLHISQTATYYLLLKKCFKQGRSSIYYLDSTDFDPMLLELENNTFQDVQTAEIPPHLPPNRSSTAPLEPGNQDYNFQVFMPWEQLYYRVTQLTELKNNLFLTGFIDKSLNKNPRKPRYGSRKQQNYSANDMKKDVSLNLPIIKEQSPSKRYSGYFENLSKNHLQKLNRLTARQRETFQKTRKFHRSPKKGVSRQQQPNVKQLMRLLEKLTTTEEKAKEIQVLKHSEPQTEEKKSTLSMRYRIKSHNKK